MQDFGLSTRLSCRTLACPQDFHAGLWPVHKTFMQDFGLSTRLSCRTLACPQDFHAGLWPVHKTFMQDFGLSTRLSCRTLACPQDFHAGLWPVHKTFMQDFGLSTRTVPSFRQVKILRCLSVGLRYRPEDMNVVELLLTRMPAGSYRRRQFVDLKKFKKKKKKKKKRKKKSLSLVKYFLFVICRGFIKWFFYFCFGWLVLLSVAWFGFLTLFLGHHFLHVVVLTLSFARSFLSPFSGDATIFSYSSAFWFSASISLLFGFSSWVIVTVFCFVFFCVVTSSAIPCSLVSTGTWICVSHF